MKRLALLLVATTAHADPAQEPRWYDGDHLSGEWGGKRPWLADHGVTLDVIYATELFATPHERPTLLGHVDAALTLTTDKLGLWDGGTFYALVQNNHGTGINTKVGSSQPITNLESDPYTQLTELFLEQTLLDEAIKFRVGKQDANRDFGTPRFGGNFINNNFGMFPNSPLPTYPTTGLGAVVAVSPLDGIVAKAGVYEGSPGVGGFGLDTAFKSGAGYTLIGGLFGTRHFGANDKSGGTTSIGVWHQSGTFMAVDGGDRTFGTNDGFFFQHDERIFLHPEDADDPSGLNAIFRFSWARPDRTAVSRYAGCSFAWHGGFLRSNDTIGIGFGYFTIAQPLNGAIGPGDEWFVEAFYKLRVTAFASLEPDVQFYRHPGGDGPDAWIAGARIKLKL